MPPILTTSPDPNTKAPRFKCPPGTVGTHIHLFGPAEKYHWDPNTYYVARDATPEMNIALQDRLGFSNSVIVSGGAYGRNTAHLSDTLTRFGDRFRGIARCFRKNYGVGGLLRLPELGHLVEGFRQSGGYLGRGSTVRGVANRHQRGLHGLHPIPILRIGLGVERQDKQARKPGEKENFAHLGMSILQIGDGSGGRWRV